MSNQGGAPAGPVHAHRGGRAARRFLIAANVVVALLLVASGLVYGYTRYTIGHIHTGSSKGLASTGESGVDRKQSYNGLPPENILLIGNQSRAGQNVNFGNAALNSSPLADVIMLLHLDPRDRTASLLSIPRDLFSPMPAGSPVGSWQKINAALNDGNLGINNLVTAIHDDFGITINHYVEVDFNGFLQTVNALNGIRMDFPERLYDAYSGLDINHTGCQLIHGQQALALVRSRHLQYDPPGVSPSDPAAWPYDPESDLARIVRDHTFVKVLATTAEEKGIGNPVTAANFISAVTNQLTIDPQLKSELIQLIVRYHTVNPAAAPARTFPVTAVNNYFFDGYNAGDVLFPSQPADLHAIRAWDAGSLPTPVQPRAVEVYDAANTPGLAARTGAALRADGFHVSLEAEGRDPGSVSETVVQYHPGQVPMGFAVLEKLNGAVVMQASKSVPAGTVIVQAGTTFSVQSPTTPTTPTTGTTAPASSTSSTAAGGGTPTSTTTTTTVPTPGGQVPTSAQDQVTPYDPRPC